MAVGHCAKLRCDFEIQRFPRTLEEGCDHGQHNLGLVLPCNSLTACQGVKHLICRDLTLIICEGEGGVTALLLYIVNESK